MKNLVPPTRKAGEMSGGVVFCSAEPTHERFWNPSFVTEIRSFHPSGHLQSAPSFVFSQVPSVPPPTVLNARPEDSSAR